MTDHDTLGDELYALGEPLRTRVADDEVVDSVAARVAGLPAPRRRRLSGWIDRFAAWWRWVVAGIVGLLVVVALVPPIRAAVVDWFDFGGVVVRDSPDSAPSSAPGPPTVEGQMSLVQARHLVAFDVLTPSVLGEPDAVDVTNERRILSMAWETPDGALRLDQFSGALEPVFVKKIYRDADVDEVRGGMALWLEEPHEVAVLDSDGSTYEAPPRLAGSTLIWQAGSTTVRLEGDLTRQRALEIARSASTR